MRFKRSSVRYSDTPEPVTPYQAAQQLWDDRIGSARVQARNWRLMALGCFSLLCAVSVGLLWQSARSTVTPYVVEVNTRGDVRAVGPATEQYRPTDAQIGYHLSRLIRNVRSLPIDPIVLRENWLEAYNYVTARGAAFLNDYARVHDPFTRLGRETVAIDATSIVRASDSSFQIRWTERTYLNGSLASTQHWTAILSTVLQPPRNEESISKNPLGIYVDGLNWSRELETDKASGDSR